MDKKIFIPIVVVVLVILVLFAGYLSDNGDDGVRVTFNVSSEGPFKLSDLTEDVKSNSYFEGYDNETLSWMESLGDKSVFSSADEYVIIDNREAGKIPSQFATDVFIYELFTAEIVEEHSLISGNHSKNVVYVKNVEYIGEEIQDLGLV